MPDTAWSEERLSTTNIPAYVPAKASDEWQVALLCSEVAVLLGAPVCGVWMWLRWMGW